MSGCLDVWCEEPGRVCESAANNPGKRLNLCKFVKRVHVSIGRLKGARDMAKKKNVYLENVSLRATERLNWTTPQQQAWHHIPCKTRQRRSCRKHAKNATPLHPSRRNKTNELLEADRKFVPERQ